MLDTSNAPRRSRPGAGCISFEKGAHARAFRGCTKTGPPTTTTLRLDTSCFLLRPGALARRRKLAFRAPQKQQRSGSILPPVLLRLRALCSPPKAGFPTKPALRLDTSLPFYAGSSVWAPEPSRVKNRIREECQQFLGFEYQKRIDSMIFLPFGLRSFFGAKNWIREARNA